MYDVDLDAKFTVQCNVKDCMRAIPLENEMQIQIHKMYLEWILCFNIKLRHKINL